MKKAKPLLQLAKIIINGKLKGIYETFSKKDIEEAEEVAKIALEDMDTSEFNEKEYVKLINLLQLQALEDLYNRRYKNS